MIKKIIVPQQSETSHIKNLYLQHMDAYVAGQTGLCTFQTWIKINQNNMENNFKTHIIFLLYSTSCPSSTDYLDHLLATIFILISFLYLSMQDLILKCDFDVNFSLSYSLLDKITSFSDLHLFPLNQIVPFPNRFSHTGALSSQILCLLTPHHHLSTNSCISQLVYAIDFISHVFNKKKKKKKKERKSLFCFFVDFFLFLSEKFFNIIYLFLTQVLKLIKNVLK